MIQEPCASDGRLAWVSESAEQAVNTPNDEERLEQMSHPKNKAMERMTPPKGGMTLLGSARKAMERSCLISWSGVQVTACPKHNAFDSSGFLCLGALGDPPLPFLPQTKQRTSHGNSACESAKTDNCVGNHPRSTKSRCFAQDTGSSRVRGVIRDGYRRPCTGLLQINSPKKPTNRGCPCEESTDEPTQSETSTG